MEPINQLSFAVSDRIDDAEVGPEHVPLALLNDFPKEVTDFLKGSTRDIDPTEVKVSIESGSLMFVASGLLAATTLWTDLQHLEAENSLGSIDPKRAAVLERWQANARQNPHRRYLVKNRTTGYVLVSIDSRTDLRKVENVWVHVEKYLHGKVVDMGGKQKPNVHLELENGQLLRISATQEMLKNGEQNRLYRDALLHVTADENLVTGELRNMLLIGFEAHHPRYDEKEFNLMVERGTKAWADVPDSANWLESLRGGEA